MENFDPYEFMQMTPEEQRATLTDSLAEDAEMWTEDTATHKLARMLIGQMRVFGEAALDTREDAEKVHPLVFALWINAYVDAYDTYMKIRALGRLKMI